MIGQIDAIYHWWLRLYQHSKQPTIHFCRTKSSISNHFLPKNIPSTLNEFYRRWRWMNGGVNEVWWLNGVCVCVCWTWFSFYYKFSIQKFLVYIVDLAWQCIVCARIFRVCLCIYRSLMKHDFNEAKLFISHVEIRCLRLKSWRACARWRWRRRRRR